MAGDPKNPKVGEFAIDATELAGVLVDLPPGELQGMKTEQDGFEAVIAEILANQPTVGEKAGVTAADVKQLQTAEAQIAKIDKFLEPAAKLVEMLTETRYHLDDQRQRTIFNIAQSVDRRGKDAPELLAKYEKTRAYRSAPAKKGVKTRQKKTGDSDVAPGGDGAGAQPK